jgi:hypothetical protein
MSVIGVQRSGIAGKGLLGGSGAIASKHCGAGAVTAAVLGISAHRSAHRSAHIAWVVLSNLAAECDCVPV